MGAWGTGIFDNDTAMDMRSAATELMALNFSSRQVSEILLDGQASEDADAVLALAMTQHKLGRVDASVAAKSMEMISTGQALRQWMDLTEPGDRTIKQRERHLMKAGETLRSPAPAPKRVKISDDLKRRIDITCSAYPWREGGLYAYRTRNRTTVFAAAATGEITLGRHYRSIPDGYELLGALTLRQVILVLLNYKGEAVPTAAEALRLQPYLMQPSQEEAEATARTIFQLHAHAVANAGEPFEVFVDRTKDMLGHFTAEKLRERFEEVKAVAREQADALADTEAAVRRHYFKRFLIDPLSPVPVERLVDLGKELDVEGKAAAHDFTIKVESVDWDGLDSHLAELGFLN